MLPPPRQGWAVKTGALSAGSDVQVLQNGSVAQAEARCAAVGACVGFTYRRSAAAATCADVPPAVSDLRIYLKSSAAGNGDADWCTVTQPPKPLGVFFENVETIYTSATEQARANGRARVGTAVAARSDSTRTQASGAVHPR